MQQADRHGLALAAAAFLELDIEPSMLAGVADNLALLQRHASNVTGFALDADEEVACVFEA